MYIVYSIHICSLILFHHQKKKEVHIDEKSSLTHTHANTCTHTHTHAHTRTHTHTHAHTRTHINVYLNIHIRIHNTHVYLKINLFKTPNRQTDRQTDIDRQTD
jgi:hypothetical protein